MKLYNDMLNEYQQGSSQPERGGDSPVTWSELSDLRNHLDELWGKLGVDISFSHHFFDRVNDPRNRKQITISELEKLFSDTYRKHGQNISIKVKPESDGEFEAVLTDLSTKVNLPFILKWDRKMRELKLIAKTVMRKDNFNPGYNDNGHHKVVPKLTVQQYEPKGTVMTEKKMKTYRDIVEWVGWNTPEVAPIATPQAVDDVDAAAHSVEKPEMLEKLNAYCHDIANHQYINPYYPLNALWKKLMMVGINFDLKKVLMTNEQGRVEIPLSQFGGRFGVLGSPDGFVSGDDGIKDRVPGGLNLVVTYQKTGGIYTLDVAIEHGTKAIGFGEETVNENDGFSLAAAKATRQAYKTGKKEDHTAAMKAHLSARGGEFAPQPPKGSNFQPNVDRWNHHDKQAKMHKAEITEAKSNFNSTGSYTNHPFHKTLVQHGYEHETSHNQDPYGRVHSYFHPQSQHVISIGSTAGSPAWGSEQSNGNSAASLSKHIKDVNSLSSDDAKKWRTARPNVKKK